MKGYRPARRRIEVSVGESVRLVRELQGLSQNALARRTGIPQATLSAIENDRVRLGVERAKVLARALKCHPGVLVFPGWVLPTEAAGEPPRATLHLSAPPIRSGPLLGPGSCRSRPPHGDILPGSFASADPSDK
jgi:transcriptional regulator with XRE-family HTH domain